MNKILFTFIFIILAFTTPAYAFQMQGCSSNCASCHNLTKEEASELIKADVLKASVLSVKQAPAKGMWEVQLYHDNTITSVYVDYGKKYMITGDFIPLDEIGKRPVIHKVDPAKIPVGNALIMGNPKAKTKIIVFTDPDCPYCRKLHAEIKDIIKERNDIAFYIKLYPLKDIHPGAYDKAKAIQCAKSIKLLDDAFNGKELPKASCDTDEIDKNMKLANENGIGGTPTLIFPDGTMIPSYLTKAQIYELLGIKAKTP